MSKQKHSETVSNENSVGMISDEQLMTAYYSGDDDAFAQLWERYFLSLASYATKRLPQRLSGRQQSAEDCASESLLKVLASKDRPSTRWKAELGTFKKWIHRIVRNQTIDLIRKERGQVVVLSSMENADKNMLQNTTPDHRKSSADKAVQREQQLALLWNGVDQLPDELRMIFTLKYHDDLKHREIASQLNCSKSTISRRLQKAEQMLQQLSEAA